MKVHNPKVQNPKTHPASLRVLKYESQEELFFACTSFLILLFFATADILVRTW
ncbi:hypothetical protein BH10BDE1_BH10BDE1_17990 [soil metagenome]